MTVDRLKQLYTYSPAIGYSTEKMTIFLAMGLKIGSS